MLPTEIGAKYSKIASWWSERHDDSDYGLKPLLYALSFCPKGLIYQDPTYSDPTLRLVSYDGMNLGKTCLYV